LINDKFQLHLLLSLLHDSGKIAGNCYQLEDSIFLRYVAAIVWYIVNLLSKVMCNTLGSPCSHHLKSLDCIIIDRDW